MPCYFNLKTLNSFHFAIKKSYVQIQTMHFIFLMDFFIITIDKESICMKYLLHLFNSKCSAKTQNFIFKKNIFTEMYKKLTERGVQTIWIKKLVT